MMSRGRFETTGCQGDGSLDTLMMPPVPRGVPSVSRGVRRTVRDEDARMKYKQAEEQAAEIKRYRIHSIHDYDCLEMNMKWLRPNYENSSMKGVSE